MRQKMFFSRKSSTGYRKEVLESFSVLEHKDKLKLVLIGGANTLLGLLDIIAVLLFGLIGSLTVSNLSSQSISGATNWLINAMGLNNASIQLQVATLGFIVAFLLLSKSYISLLISRKIISFLSFRSAATSMKLLDFNFSQDLIKFRAETNQKTIYALTHGVQTVIVNVVGGIVFLIGDLSLLVFFAFGLFAVDFSVAITSLILFSTVGVFLGKRTNRVSAKLGEDSARLGIISNQLLEKMYFCYRELVVRNVQKVVAGEIGELRFGIAYANARLAFLGNFSKYIMEITLVFGGLALAALQFYLNSASRAVAVISIFLVASTRIVPAVLRAQTGLAQVRASLGVAKPTLELINSLNQSLTEKSYNIKPAQINDESESRDFSPTVVVDNVSFGYSSKEDYLIKNLSLTISEGQFVAITGPSGAGKTTILDLMLGLHIPTSGQIKLSNTEPRKAFQNWPGAVAYVPQDVFIFDGTLKENVCLGFASEDIADHFVKELLVALGLENLINEVGIYGQVGDRGSRLSGGQRQRLGIARALLTRPKLLILDEATSSLDAESEKLIGDYLEKMKSKVTVVVVAHRLSTIKNADRILYLKDGTVEIDGTWSQLCISHPHIFK
jgi:ABC-type multidrug transport system fused ATPase/permease subunit